MRDDSYNRIFSVTGQINIQFMISLIMFAVIFTMILTDYSQMISVYMDFSYKDRLENIAHAIAWQIINDPGYRENCYSGNDECFDWDENNYSRIGFAHKNYAALSIEKIQAFDRLYNIKIRQKNFAENYLKLTRALNLPNNTFYIKIERVASLEIKADIIERPHGVVHKCLPEFPICATLNSSRVNITANFYINRTDLMGKLQCHIILIKGDKEVRAFECPQATIYDRSSCVMTAENLCRLKYDFETEEIESPYTIVAIFNGTVNLGIRRITINILAENKFMKGIGYGIFPKAINCTNYPLGGPSCTIRVIFRPENDIERIRIKSVITNVTDLEGNVIDGPYGKYNAEIVILPEVFRKLYGGGQREFQVTFRQTMAGYYYGNITVSYYRLGQLNTIILPFRLKVLPGTTILEAGQHPQPGLEISQVKRYVSIYYPGGYFEPARFMLKIS